MSARDIGEERLVLRTVILMSVSLSSSTTLPTTMTLIRVYINVSNSRGRERRSGERDQCEDRKEERQTGVQVEQAPTDASGLFLFPSSCRESPTPSHAKHLLPSLKHTINMAAHYFSYSFPVDQSILFVLVVGLVKKIDWTTGAIVIWFRVNHPGTACLDFEHHQPSQ